MPTGLLQNNQKKQLRIAFAMGGGVSLGTFSGAALTEALKMLIITAYTDDESYDDVVIDVFSGASAGAIALGIMIRMMVGYEDKLDALLDLDKYKDCTVDTIKTKMWETIEREYDIAGIITDSRKKEEIISCQIAQDFQELIWVEEVDIAGLGSLNKLDAPLLNAGGILSSEFLDGIAEKLIYPEDGEKIVINENSPINNRFLFSCTLTRLMAEQINSFKEFESKFYDSKATDFLKKLLPIVAKDGASSENHKDFRIFDIDLRKEEERKINLNIVDQPTRWIKIANTNTHSEERNQFSIHDQDTWKMIIQTTLACGAFPFAFEPKALNRRGFELSQDGKAQDEIFSYIDGGVLNNEPISEAFRLSSFMDGTYDNDNFDRLVIFVDPSINHSKKSKTTAVYKKYSVSEESGKTKNRPSLQRIIDQVGPLLKVIMDQSTISELDKASNTLDKFRKRDQLREMYKDTVRLGFPESWDEIKDSDRKEEIQRKLEDVLTKVMPSIKALQKRISIPANFPMMQQEVAKMLRNDPDYTFFSKQFHSSFNEANDKAEWSKNLLKPAVFISSHKDMIQDYVIFLYFIMIDATLDLIGKNSNYALLPIGPIVIEDGEPKQIELLGQPFSAFLGFFHKRLRKADFDRGRLSACDILYHLNQTKKYDLEIGKIKVLNGGEIDQIQMEVKRFLELRVYEQLMKSNIGEITNMSGKRYKFWEDWFTNGIVRLLKSKVLDNSRSLNLKQNKVLDLEIRIKVSHKKIQVNHMKYKSEFMNKDNTPIEIPGEDGLYLVLTAEYLYRIYGKDEDKWMDSSFVKGNKIEIDIDGFLNDKSILVLNLPIHIADEVNKFLYPILEIDLSEYSISKLKNGIELDTESAEFMSKWNIVEGKKAKD